GYHRYGYIQRYGCPWVIIYILPGCWKTIPYYPGRPHAIFDWEIAIDYLHIPVPARFPYETQVTCYLLSLSTGIHGCPRPLFPSGRFLIRRFLCLYGVWISSSHGCPLDKYRDLLWQPIYCLERLGI